MSSFISTRLIAPPPLGGGVVPPPRGGVDCGPTLINGIYIFFKIKKKGRKLAHWILFRGKGPLYCDGGKTNLNIYRGQ